MEFAIQPYSRFTGDPPPMPVNPLDIAEDDMVCTPNQTAATTFELADFPGVEHRVPLAVSGERQHLLAEMDSVSVTSWNGADRVRITGDGGAQVVLTPSSSSANLANATFWIGTAKFEGGRLDSSGNWNNPVVSITHSCPSNPGTGTRSVDQAYALDLDTLSDAVDEATDSAGLADLILSASQSTWPVYVVRVFPIGGGPLSTGETHVLRLEMQGTQAGTWIPITQTQLGRWDVDYDGGDWSVVGSVARNPGTLTLDLDSGSVETPLGTLQLDPVVVQLDAYPEEEE